MRSAQLTIKITIPDFISSLSNAVCCDSGDGDGDPQVNVSPPRNGLMASSGAPPQPLEISITGSFSTGGDGGGGGEGSDEAP